MKNILLVIGLVASTMLYSEAEPRMQLLVSDKMIMNDLKQCAPSSEYFGLMMANASVKISEHDIASWDRKTGILTLDPIKFPKQQFRPRLENHCFYLEIDGKLVTSGAVLSSISARLSKAPTIIVPYGKKDIEMKLVLGNSTDAKPIHVDELNTVLKKQL